MTILEALKQPDSNLRIQRGNRCLEWDDGASKLFVYERPYDRREVRFITETDDEAEAVAALMGDNDPPRVRRSGVFICKSCGKDVSNALPHIDCKGMFRKDHE